MKRTALVTGLCVGLLVALAACGDDETFQLIFEIDASFQGPHAGDAITVAVVRTADGAVLDEQTGTVSETADPAFTFTWLGILELNEGYQVHYWIDSNFGGGTVGTCDPTSNDHQWNVTIPAVAGDVTVAETHDGSTVVDVCSTFAS